MLFFDKNCCPSCGESVLEHIEKQEFSSSKLLREDEKQLLDSQTDIFIETPSLKHFLKYYKTGDYIKALFGNKPPSNPRREEIIEAIDLFEMEHFDKSQEWSVPIARIKEDMMAREQDNAPLTEIPKAIEMPPIDRIKRDKAIHLLLEADRLNRGGYLEECIHLCGESLKIDPYLKEAYQMRAFAYLLLDNWKDYLDNVVQDCTSIIAMDPQNYQAYNDRGRAYVRKMMPEKAIDDYSKSLQIDPAYTIAALNKMSAEISLNRFQDAVSTYGHWRKDIVTPDYMLIASSLVCIALALDGRDYRRYMAPLKNISVRFKYLDTWNPYSIDQHIQKLTSDQFYPERVLEAKGIQELFKEHMIS